MAAAVLNMPRRDIPSSRASSRLSRFMIRPPRDQSSVASILGRGVRGGNHCVPSPYPYGAETADGAMYGVTIANELEKAILREGAETVAMFLAEAVIGVHRARRAFERPGRVELVTGGIECLEVGEHLSEADRERNGGIGSRRSDHRERDVRGPACAAHCDRARVAGQRLCRGRRNTNAESLLVPERDDRVDLCRAARRHPGRDRCDGRKDDRHRQEGPRVERRDPEQHLP